MCFLGIWNRVVDRVEFVGVVMIRDKDVEEVRNKLSVKSWRDWGDWFSRGFSRLVCWELGLLRGFSDIIGIEIIWRKRKAWDLIVIINYLLIKIGNESVV